MKRPCVRDGLLGSGGPKPSAFLHAKAKRRAFNLCTPHTSDFVFQITYIVSWDTLIQQTLIFIIKMNNTRGDRTDTWAKAKIPAHMCIPQVSAY